MQIPIYTTQITEPGTVNFEESEKLRKVKLLRLFSIISLGFYTANWLISLAVIAWTNQSFQPFGIISTLAYFVLCISCYTLAKGKFYHPAIWLLLLISLYPPVLVYLSFGTQLPTIMEFALPVVLSVVLASAFETALVTTFCVVFILSIYVTQDFLKIYTPPLALNQETAFWIGVFITIGVVPTVVAILVIPFRDQLRTVKTQNRSLQELSFTLKSLNDQLIAEIEERRNAEEALKESETRYRTLATSFPNGAVFLYDQNLCCILAEGQELARTRYSKEVLEGHRISEIFPPDIGQILESHCRKTLSGASSSFELAVDGEVYQVFVVPVKDEQGEISAGMVMTQNISKRLKAEQALRESEERLRTVITNAPLVLFALDPDGVCTFSEGLGLEALGYKPAELVGQSILELYKDSPVFYRDIKAALQGQAIENVSEVGSLTFHNWFSPVYDKQDCFDGVIGVSINISEHRAAEKALRKSEAKNRALLNAIPDTILAISQDGYYLDYKPAHDLELACPPETFLGKNIEEMWLSENAPTAMKLINEVLSTGQPATFEYNLNIKEKELFFEARAAAVSNYSEVLVIVRDITEQKKAESEMQNTLKKGRELGELKNRFISMASHEFRTPLSVILSSSELLEHYYQTFSPEKRQQHFDRIKAAITYMTE
ncbi:MAG TPA: PAS domain-containing protein, partial [Chloroflexia bacterium]|nr:PAS domain-containing protein [Chloroflexia bacterium]